MTDTEKAALEKRIDELCAEVERLHADQAHWELGNCPNCPNVASLQEALEQNAKLQQENQSVGIAAYELGRKSMASENAKLLWLVTDMCACFRIGAEREGISKQWCYELFDTYAGKLRELGIEGK